MRKHVIIWILMTATVITGSLAVKHLFPDEKKHDVIEDAEATGNYVEAKREYKRLISGSFNNIAYHRGYLSSHFGIPKRLGKHRVRNDDEILREYETYLKEGRDVDIVNYGIGYFYLLQDKYDDALSYLLKVKTSRFAYVNNSTGFAFKALKQYDKAQEYFRKEIALSGNIDAAYDNLAECMALSDDYAGIEELLRSEKARAHVSKGIIRQFDLVKGRYADYLYESLADMFRRVTPEGSAAAVLIAVIWIIYFIRIDVLEPESKVILLLVFLMGVASVVPAGLLYDLWDIHVKTQIDGTFLNDIRYSILCIGVIEETVKLAPFLILLACTRLVNESLDYIVFASLAALGFATMENMLYFNDMGLKNINGRAISSVILHMSLTSLSVYGYVYRKYGKKRFPISGMLITFPLAVLIHGLYDLFLLSNSYLNEFAVFSFVVLVFMIRGYSSIISESIGNSEFGNRKRKAGDNTLFLLYGILITLMAQTAFLIVKFDFSGAMRRLAFDGFTSICLILVIINSLSDVGLKKKKRLSVFQRDI